MEVLPLTKKMLSSFGLFKQEAGFTVDELFATENLHFHVEQWSRWTYKNLPLAHLVHWQGRINSLNYNLVTYELNSQEMHYSSVQWCDQLRTPKWHVWPLTGLFGNCLFSTASSMKLADSASYLLCIGSKGIWTAVSVAWWILCMTLKYPLLLLNLT